MNTFDATPNLVDEIESRRLGDHPYTVRSGGHLYDANRMPDADDLEES